MVTNNSPIFIFIFILSLFVMPVSAFEDDFNDNDTVGWTVAAGTWSAINSYLVSDVGSSSIYHPVSEIYPAQFSIKVKRIDLGSQLEYVFRNDGTNIHKIKFWPNEIILQQTGESDVVITISDNYIWYAVTITVDGANYIFEVKKEDDTLIDSKILSIGSIGHTNNIYLNCLMDHECHYDDVCVVESEYGESGAVVWDRDPYYTSEIATITTTINNFDDTTYSYYLDLYSTYEYLTTYEIASAVDYNYYTFPLGWTDTSLLAKLVRVTDPYATNEVQLAYDISHFETLDWDTTVSFNKSSYNPSDTLKVTWSGAADGSSVWLRAGDDGEVIEYDVAYSGSFTFNVPANTTETYYIVDVATGGYSQAQASCVISSVPDFFFNYSVSTNLDEYSPGDTVTVTYSSDKICGIRVIKTISDNTYHSVSSLSGGYNKTWQFYISDDEPFGFYDVYLVDISDTILDDVRYSLLPSTSSLEILQLSINLHEEFAIFAQTVNVSFLTIEDPDGVEVWNESVDALMYKYVYYTPTTKHGIYTAYLYDDSTLSDTIMVYYAEAPDIIDPNGPVIDEDVLDDDETMTEYYNEKFRDFAPTIWGFFMLMCLLFLMSILTSFNSGGKRR